jgi:hypothetical protein
MFAVALVDIALVLGSLGWELGWTAIGHDPGKFVFHGLLLPAAFGLLVRRLPRDTLTVASSSARAVLALLFLGLTPYMLMYAVSSGKEGFCTRIPVPADVSSGKARDQLIALRVEFGRDLARVREGKLIPSALAASAPARIDESRNLVHKLSGECEYEQRSARQQWSILLTFLGLLFIEAVVLYLAARVVTRTRLSQTEMETLLVVVTLGLLWFPLRVYSEWYINFAREGEFWFEDFTTAGAVAACVGLVGFSLWVSRKVATTVFAAVAGLIPVTLGVVQKYNAPAIQSLALSIGSAPPMVAIGVYLCIALTVAGAMHYLWDPQRDA